VRGVAQDDELAAGDRRAGALPGALAVRGSLDVAAARTLKAVALRDSCIRCAKTARAAQADP